MAGTRALCALLVGVATRAMSQYPTEIPLLHSTLPVWEGDACLLQTNVPGLCSRLSNCPLVAQAVLVGYPPKICSYDKYVSIVCCPISAYEPQLPNLTSTTETTTTTTASTTTEKQEQPGQKSKRACETYYQELLDFEKSLTIPVSPQVIVGGVRAAKDEFPHMAAIGYGEEGDIAWFCGGSLISPRFVLTAGHCLRSRDRGPARLVRLGDLNLLTSDQDGGVQQLTVVRRIAHPRYRPPSHYNDVALLRLDRDATWALGVRPACLHRDEPVGFPALATGWGLTDWAAGTSSADLMKVALSLQPAEVCEKNHQSLIGTRRLRFGFDKTSMLCVGELGGGKDTCQGDSGGPYQYDVSNTTHNLFNVVGVTSFGLSVCGAKNSPAVYSRVAHFVPWIESVVWP